MKVLFLITLLVLGSFSFKIRQNGGFGESMQDANAGFQALGQAFQDSVTAGQDALGAATGQITQLMQQTMGAMTGATAGGRLQQGGAGFNQALQEIQGVWQDLGEATEDFLASGRDAFDATVAQTDQIIDNASGATQGRLQQGGNGYAQAIQSLQQVWQALGEATEDAIDAGQQTVDATVAQTDQLIDNLDGAAAAGASANAGASVGGRLQQGANGWNTVMQNLQSVWQQLGEATEDAIDAGQQTVDATVAQTDQIIDNLDGAAAAGAAGRLQQGGAGFNQALQSLQSVWQQLGEAAEDAIDAGQQAVDATVAQTDQVIDNLDGAAATSQ